MKETKRKAFNFLRSYFDVLNQLEKDSDKLEFLESIINKQFLNEDPKDLGFTSMLCYESQRHSIESSVKGWIRVAKTDMQGNPLTNPPTVITSLPTTNPKEVEEEEQVEEKEETIPPPTTVDAFDWDNLRLLINRTFGRQFKVINKEVKAKYNSRLKNGYTKEDVKNAILNCHKDPFHKDKNYKHCTPEYFSRSNTLDLHSAVTNTPTGMIQTVNSVEDVKDLYQ